MSALDQLNGYLRRLERRLRLLAWSRGFAIAGCAALAATVVLAIAGNWWGLSGVALSTQRALLYLCLALAVAFGLVVPLLSLNRRWTAHRAEAQVPQFQERLLTVAERPDETGPFAQLVAEDALTIARDHQPESLAPSAWILGLMTSAGAAVTVLLWLIFAGPGFLGYGSALLWGSTPKAGLHPLREIVAAPGDRTIRRKADQMITARLLGFSADQVRLAARYRNAPKWDEVPMAPESAGSGYQFLFAGVDDTMDYYIEAGGVRSRTFTLTVRDLPSVHSLRVRYRYPSWLGLADVVENPGGDLRAVEGTDAEVSIETDRPLDSGALVLDDGSRIALERGAGNWLSARVPIRKDGSYYVAAIDSGQAVRLTDDYFIEARKDSPPTVRVTWPGRDVKVSPIEELTVKLEAQDDFGLKEASLRYSVNGGPEKSVSLLPQVNTKKSEQRTTLALEDFKLVPGDVISYYAVARDARSTVRTDIYFAQAQPFDLRFMQAQQSGGMGGANDEENNISDREKEVIAATWNLTRNPKDPVSAARFLGDTQAKLGDQAHTLAERIRKRQIEGASPEIKTFIGNMDQAAAAMQEATSGLRGMKWSGAMGPEQKALQHLLRAEAVFKDIQVAFGSQGNGSGASTGRDLSRLLDLELDTEKNQYETGEQSGAKNEQARKMDEALQKLKELARRQQELAAQNRSPQQQFQQRWEQETLRREAEELRRQMEEMQRQQSQRASSQQGQQQGQSQGQQQGQQQGQPQGQQQGSSGSPASASASRAGSSGSFGQMSGQSRERFEQALEQLAQAEDEMRAGNRGDQQAARHAAERLQQAGEMIGNAERNQAAGQIGDLSRRAKRLADAHRDFTDRMQKKFGGQTSENEQDARLGPNPGQTSEAGRRLADEEQRMADELKDIEQRMSDGARSLAGGQPDASSKLRDTLSEAQQNEIELRLRKNAEWVRKGQGMYTWMREQVTAMGLQKMVDGLQQAQSALRDTRAQQASNPAPGSQSGQSAKDLQSALDEVGQMRERLDQLRQSAESKGQGGTAGTSGASDAQQSASEGLNRVRRLVRGKGEIGLGSDLEDLGGQIRQLSPRGDPGELARRLERTVIPGLERVELELRRMLDAQQAGNIHTASPEPIPEGYAGAVADYFRRLSKASEAKP